jgi:hypothetical protein
MMKLLRVVLLIGALCMVSFVWGEIYDTPKDVGMIRQMLHVFAVLIESQIIGVLLLLCAILPAVAERKRKYGSTQPRSDRPPAAN